jgi:hypothetical protein
MTDNPQNDEDERAGDLLVGAAAIQRFLVHLGFPESVNPYDLKRRSGWPIGKTSDDGGGSLVASKRRLLLHAEKITRGNSNTAA